MECKNERKREGSVFEKSIYQKNCNTKKCNNTLNKQKTPSIIDIQPKYINESVNKMNVRKRSLSKRNEGAVGETNLKKRKKNPSLKSKRSKYPTKSVKINRHTVTKSHYSTPSNKHNPKVKQRKSTLAVKVDKCSPSRVVAPPCPVSTTTKPRKNISLKQKNSKAALKTISNKIIKKSKTKNTAIAAAKRSFCGLMVNSIEKYTTKRIRNRRLVKINDDGRMDCHFDTRINPESVYSVRSSGLHGKKKKLNTNKLAPTKTKENDKITNVAKSKQARLKNDRDLKSICEAALKPCVSSRSIMTNPLLNNIINKGIDLKNKYIDKYHHLFEPKSADNLSVKKIVISPLTEVNNNVEPLRSSSMDTNIGTTKYKKKENNNKTFIIPKYTPSKIFENSKLKFNKERTSNSKQSTLTSYSKFTTKDNNFKCTKFSNDKRRQLNTKLTKSYTLKSLHAVNQTNNNNPAKTVTSAKIKKFSSRNCEPKIKLAPSKSKKVIKKNHTDISKYDNKLKCSKIRRANKSMCSKNLNLMSKPAEKTIKKKTKNVPIKKITAAFKTKKKTHKNLPIQINFNLFDITSLVDKALCKKLGLSKDFKNEVERNFNVAIGNTNLKNKRAIIGEIVDDIQKKIVEMNPGSEVTITKNNQPLHIDETTDTEVIVNAIMDDKFNELLKLCKQRKALKFTDVISRLALIYIYIYIYIPYQVEIAHHSITRNFHLFLSFIAVGSSSILSIVSSFS